MTAKSAFTSDEWKVVLEGPPAAGMIVVTAARGGMFRETIAMAKAYTEARGQHGESELLDEIVSAKPQLDHTSITPPRSSRTRNLRTSARRCPCSRARQPPRNSTTTGASPSPSPTRSRPRTGRTART